MSWSSEVLADSPLWWGRQGESSGTTMVDSSGNGHDGTYAGGITLGQTGLVSGDSDTCAKYSSASGTVTGAAWMATSTTVTAEALIKPASVSGGSYNFIVVRDDNNGTGNAWWLTIKAGKLTALCRGTEFSGSTTLVAGTVYHVAFTYDGTTAKLYLNGALDGSSARSGSMSSTNYDLLIGRWGNGSLPLYFDGLIDEVIYYNTALSATRILAHYNAATAVSIVLTGGGGLSGNGVQQAIATITLASAATLAATAVSGLVANIALTGVGGLAITGLLQVPSSVVMAGTGGLSAAPIRETSASISMDGAGTLGAGAQINPLYKGDISNALNGLDLSGSAAVEVTVPVVAVTTAVKVVKAIPLPVPTMVNGRPT